MPGRCHCEGHLTASKSGLGDQMSRNEIAQLTQHGEPGTGWLRFCFFTAC